jgi:hypothetical protein
VAEAITSDTRYPWIAWCESGKGRVVGEAPGIWEYGNKQQDGRKMEKFFQDFVIYMVYFSVGKPIPNDV